MLMSLAVLLWCAGFDIIYSCLDLEFDQRAGLHSLPKRFGIAPALRASSALHGSMVLVLLLIALWPPFGWLYVTGVLASALVLFYEHSIVHPDDLSRANTAFFTLNGVVSLGLMAVAVADILL
jgi:4-hydroxybenzoate polyprenyltransferase